MFGFGSSDNSKYMSSEESSTSSAIYDSFGTFDLDYAYRKFAPKMYDNIQSIYDIKRRLDELPTLQEAIVNARGWHAKYVELEKRYNDLLERIDKKLSEQEKKQSTFSESQR